MAETTPFADEPFQDNIEQLAQFHMLMQLMTSLPQGTVEREESAAHLLSSTSSTGASTSPPLTSISPGDEAPPPSSASLSEVLARPAADSGAAASRDTYSECFSTRSRAQLDALIFSLFVTSRGPPRDGFESYDCLVRTRLKCRYRVRVRETERGFVVEEKGCHSHPFDSSAYNSQGLPRSIREIVDTSFNEEWPNARRQATVAAEVDRLGLPPNPKLSRQIDNRLSYLRRTKNITDYRRMEESEQQPAEITLAFSDAPPLPHHNQQAILNALSAVFSTSTA